MEPVLIPNALSRGMRTLGWCVVSTLCVSACLDTGGSPLTVPVSPDTPGLPLFSEDISTVPRLLSDHGLDLEAAAEVEGWWDSWTMSESEGVELRSQICSSAAHRLFPVMGMAGVQDVLDRNTLGLASVVAVEAFAGSEAVSHALDQARAFHSDAWLALGRGEGEDALRLAFRTADALWEVSPEEVAKELIERATDALGRIPAAGSYSEEELIRIRRLMYGASEALEDGDYPGAIRRAYYACQLLGADPP